MSTSRTPSGTRESASDDAPVGPRHANLRNPEAEPAVGHLRHRLDPNAAAGVAAHVTVLFPFAHPDTIDSGVVDTLRNLFSRVPAFSYAFERTAWFDDQVLWLAPTDDRPFRQLTRLVHAAFPDFPPFGGAFPESVPHLTVGHEAPLRP